MRGKIIQYNGNDGAGLISADGKQFEFTIRQWRSDTAPKLNQSVEVAFEGDVIVSVDKTPDEVLMQEGADALKEKFNGLSALIESNSGDFGRGLIAKMGMNTLAAYAAFILCTFTLDFAKIQAFFFLGDFTLYQLVMASEKPLLVAGLLLACASFLLPAFVQHKFANGAAALPAIYLVLMLLSANGKNINYGIGCYVLAGITGYIAWLGFKRFSQISQP